MVWGVCVVGTGARLGGVDLAFPASRRVKGVVSPRHMSDVDHAVPLPASLRQLED